MFFYLNYILSLYFGNILHYFIKKKTRQYQIYSVILVTTVLQLEILHRVQLLTSLSSFYSQVCVNKSTKTHLHADSRFVWCLGAQLQEFEATSLPSCGTYSEHVPQELWVCRFFWSSEAVWWRVMSVLACHMAGITAARVSTGGQTNEPQDAWCSLVLLSASASPRDNTEFWSHSSQWLWPLGVC